MKTSNTLLSPETVWSEYIKCTKGKDMDLTGATYSRLKKVRGLRWPVPSEDHPGTTHRFTEGRSHTSRKIKLREEECISMQNLTAEL
ncbi:MAG: hypothetical protein U5K00_08065 [Melioribacteraceae bacterium]|nr:hypothetical protein [Melioribacteraceae bacterium]